MSPKQKQGYSVGWRAGGQEPTGQSLHTHCTVCEEFQFDLWSHGNILEGLSQGGM